MSPTIALPHPLLERQSACDWSPSTLPPDIALGYAFPRKDATGLIAGSSPRAVLGVDEKTVSATAVITTRDLDRVGDEVVPEGCDLSHYLMHPVVYFGHQSIPFPVGISEGPDGRLAVTIEPGRRVLATCYFHQSTKEAMQVFDLVRLGVLRATSIGFNPISEPVPLPRQEGKLFAGHRFDRWELLEWSFVGVPANPYCVVLREHLDRDRLAGDEITPLLRKALEPLAAAKTAWAQGYTPEKAMSENTSTQGAIVPPDPDGAKDTATEAPKLDLPAIMSQLTALMTMLAQLTAPKAEPVSQEQALEGADEFTEDLDEDEIAEEEESAAVENEEEDEENEETDEILARYRRSGKAKKRKTATPATAKRLSKSRCAMIKGAVEHLDEMADCEPGTPLTKMHSAACKYHSSSLSSILKAMEDSAAPEEESPLNPGDPDVPAASGEEKAKAIKAALDQSLSPLTERIYRLTGRRVS